MNYENKVKITIEDIKSSIKDIAFSRPTGTLTLCVITLENGFIVTGESACASPSEYNQIIGEKIAMENAINKCWALFGFVLKEVQYRASLLGSSHETQLREEARDLAGKMERLKAFLENGKADGLPDKDKILLNKQYDAMRAYLDILNTRLIRA